jgi:hypothetical protein
VSVELTSKILMFVVGARPFWSPIKYPPKMEVNAKI